eukprot:TRINITY_DN899_c0_g1_i9.p1 TRINITY_DN899_c0_g1~~TRINITY_DN899_c0_g1_i9.p1  ORF type:complete len:128 (+),score=45.43 TRINITY_DN899_c0_g1_i9:86-469(+)
MCIRDRSTWEKDIKYPNFLKDKKAKKFMEQLLSKVPEQRLGSSYASIKANPWFDNFDWDKLMEKDIKAPWVPPPEKMISKDETRRAEQQGKLVINDIKADAAGAGAGAAEKRPGKKTNQDPDWDRDF